MEIQNVRFYRNGICGEPFYSMRIVEGTAKRIAIVTSRKGGCYVVDDLCVDNPKTAGYRGDQYEPMCRAAIIKDYALSYGMGLRRQNMNSMMG
jgi:hypothetical protein